MSSDVTRDETTPATPGNVAGSAQNPAGGGNGQPPTFDDPHLCEIVSSAGEVEAIADTAIPDSERAAAPHVEATTAPEQPFASSTVIIDTESLAEAEPPAAQRQPGPPEATSPVQQSARPRSGEQRPAETTPASTSGGSAEATRPRVRLNPTVPADAVARPVPAFSGATGGAAQPSAEGSPAVAFDLTVTPELPADGSPGAAAAPQPAAVAQAATFVAAAPVDLPPRQQELSADLEAEIEAALAGGQHAAPPVPVPLPPDAEADAEESGPAAPPSPERPAEEDLTQGTRLGGKVQSVHGDDVFLDLGYRAPGVVSLRQFESGKQPEVGQTFQVTVDRIEPGEGLIHVNLPRGRRRISGNWDAVSAGQVVDCMVTGVNKGGLEITVSNLRGFLPASQVDLRFVSDLQQFVGQKLTVQVVEANPKKRNLVVSRRNYLMTEREEAETNLWQTLATGQVFQGTVKTIKDYGAFVDIGGVDGFLHVGEMSWNRVRHPSDLLAEGQQVEVQVISLDAERKRIGLGMKQLVGNPWQLAADKYAPGKTVSGRVTRTADFGAFVELEAGVEGLIHISELDHQRVRRVSDILQEGQTIDVRVLEVIPDRKRISLSLKALKEKPEDSKPADEDLAPSGGEEYTRRRRDQLKGGTGGESRGGLFGDPNRFT